MRRNIVVNGYGIKEAKKGGYRKKISRDTGRKGEGRVQAQEP